MCLACQMEDELWFAYLDHVAQQEKAAAADAARPAEPERATETTTQTRPAPPSPFACEEPPSE